MASGPQGADAPRSLTGRLAGKRCLIVGGTGGLGLAAAQRFLDEGASLLLAGLPDPDPESALARAVDQVMQVCQV